VIILEEAPMSIMQHHVGAIRPSEGGLCHTKPMSNAPCNIISNAIANIFARGRPAASS
jgi:hypothetical protein